MLDQIDLRRKMDAKAYRAALEPLEIRLGELQRTGRDLGVPVLVILEGWDAAGKGTLLNRVLRPLDPRGFRVYNVSHPSEEERLRPYLWPFWSRTPTGGQIVFMNRSWYRRLIEGRFEGRLRGGEVSEALEETRNFERQLHCGGILLIKFFIHISKKEQKKRLEKLDAQRSASWRVSKAEWDRHAHYKELAALTEEMLHATDTGNGTWTIVSGHDRRRAEIQMLTTLADAMEERVARARPDAENEGKRAASQPSPAPGSPVAPTRLDEIDLSVSIPRERYKKELPKLQDRLRDIQYILYRERIPAVVAFEGWDAAGKGGAIKRLTERLDPRGYEVHPIAAPNDIERAHYHLWRFWSAFPKAGHIAVFDRTWYGRVLVERIEGFCTPDEWRRAYSEINDMEAQWSRYGAIIVKFWMQIGPDEQLKRFEDRKDDPEKQWKITDEDWRNREKWPQYREAVEEMILRTSTHCAPWTVVEAENKEYARIKVLKTLIDAAEAFFRKGKISF
ncbi:MAG: polyphosphate:AMP phosphotransferase [Synergistaceae bacterium]|jgi:polyphosphate:AMP phosphotransferase|nr:polyphosphate:AMP phosphotransferase [Synergistaceae bacterium]